MMEKLQRFYWWTWWQLVLAENRSWLESRPILSKHSCIAARFVFPVKTSIVTKNATQGISMHRNHFTFEAKGSGSFSIITLGESTRINRIDRIFFLFIRAQNILYLVCCYMILSGIQLTLKSSRIFFFCIIDELRIRFNTFFLFLGCSSFLPNFHSRERGGVFSQAKKFD